MTGVSVSWSLHKLHFTHDLWTIIWNFFSLLCFVSLKVYLYGFRCIHRLKKLLDTWTPIYINIKTSTHIDTQMHTLTFYAFSCSLSFTHKDIYMSNIAAASNTNPMSWEPPLGFLAIMVGVASQQQPGRPLGNCQFWLHIKFFSCKPVLKFGNREWSQIRDYRQEMVLIIPGTRVKR